MTPRVPRTAMALQFFDPITAPVPVRAAALPTLQSIVAYTTWFSPAGPMDMIFASGLSSSDLIISWTW